MSRLDIHVDGTIFASNGHGGIGRCFACLLSALQQRDDVRVSLYIAGSEDQYPGSIPALKIVRLPEALQLRPSRVFAGLNSALRRTATERFWARLRSGIFHSSYYSTYESLRIPQLVTIQDMIYEIFPFDDKIHARHIEDKRGCVERAKAVVCPSKVSLADAGRFYDLDGKITAVIPYAVDPAFRRIDDEEQLRAFRQGTTGGNAYILHVGARWAHKNFLGLLAAYSRWQGRKSFHLLAVGGGPRQPLEVSAVRGLGIEDLVHFCPHVSDEELVTAYNAAAMFVTTSLYEGFGFPLVEAMACGTPAAAAEVASLPEVGGKIPVYFHPQNGDEILSALDQTLRIPRESERMREGMVRATRRSWTDVADDYVRVYREMSR